MTPRTDSRAEDMNVFVGNSTYAMRELVYADFARQLEREVAQKDAQIARLREALERLLRVASVELKDSRPDLLEQTRSALETKEP